MSIIWSNWFDQLSAFPFRIMEYQRRISEKEVKIKLPFNFIVLYKLIKELVIGPESNRLFQLSR